MLKVGDKVKYIGGHTHKGIEGVVEKCEVGSFAPVYIRFPDNTHWWAHLENVELIKASKATSTKASELQAPEHPKSIVLRIIKDKPADITIGNGKGHPPQPSLEAQEETLTQWKLDKSLRLETLAADLYTLIDLQCDYPDEPKINIPLAKLTALLANQFSAYLDMVIGGELRHACDNTIDVDARYSESPYTSIADMPISQTAQGILQAFRPLPNYANRDAVWVEWKAIREKLGIKALRAAVEIFGLDWVDGYGGDSWKKATEILIDYLTGGLTDLAFVDTCFGLHHNNNIILDKVWMVGIKLARVLDSNLKNCMQDVAQYCSPKVEKLRRRLRK